MRCLQSVSEGIISAHVHVCVEWEKVTQRASLSGFSMCCWSRVCVCVFRCFFIMSSSWLKASLGKDFSMRNPDYLHHIVHVNNIHLMLNTWYWKYKLSYIHIHFLQIYSHTHANTCFYTVDAFKLQTLHDNQRVAWDTKYVMQYLLCCAGYVKTVTLSITYTLTSHRIKFI